MKADTNSPSIPPIFWCLLHQTKKSAFSKHCAYFLAGWVLLFRPDCSIPKPKGKDNWLALLSLAGPRYWPLMLGVFVLILVGLLLLLVQTIAYAQPLLVAAGALSERVWLVVLCLSLFIWRYLKGRDYLLYCAGLRG